MLAQGRVLCGVVGESVRQSRGNSARFLNEVGLIVAVSLAVLFLGGAPLAAGPVTAQQAVTTPNVFIGWASGTDWANPFPLAAATYQLDARFRLAPPGGAWTNAVGAVDFKSQGPNPSSIATSKVTVTAVPVSATGLATATRTYLQAFPFFNMTINGNLTLTNPLPATNPPTFIQGQFWASDPMAFEVGELDTTLLLTHSLLAGTSFLDTLLEPGQPNLNVASRMGMGGSFSVEDPTTLWGSGSPIPSSPPSGAFDLYRIGIVENAAGTGVDAIVSPTPPSSLLGFEIAPDKNSAQIESLIEGANWSKTGDLWTLNSSIDLYKILITNKSEDNEGEALFVGNFASNGGQLVGAPEPGSLVLLASGVLGMMGARYCRSRRRGTLSAPETTMGTSRHSGCS